MMRGIFVTVGAIVVFIGSGWLILATNVGKHLSLLIVGTAVFGWLTMSGILFVVYAPRGLRPANLEGLNALQMRVPAIALALGAFILFVMFVMALDRYEKDRVHRSP
jgi:peptidoglycan/LPS O-acetylase OafA/YrhL